MDTLLSNQKTVFSAIAVALTLVAFVPYIASILRHKTTPHIFSWIIWGLTTVIVFAAQLQSGAGVGAWPMGISGSITIFIAVLAFIKRADSSITKVDWGFFLAALAAIPVWYLTADPLWAVVLLTAVDLLGFGPTLRKAYALPHQENMLFFGLFLLRNAFVIAALESYSITTTLFPLSICIACAALLILIYWRRLQLGSHQ